MRLAPEVDLTKYDDTAIIPTDSGNVYLDGSTILKPSVAVNDAGILAPIEKYVAPYVPNLVPETIYQAPLPIYVPPSITYNEPAPMYSTDPVEMSSEEYQRMQQEIAMLAALQNPNITVIPTDLKPPELSAPVYVPTVEQVNAMVVDTSLGLTNDLPAPQVQFMGIEEFIAISDEGIIIPQESNLVVIPISEQKEPELFNAVVEAKLAEPDKPIYDIVMETIKPLAEIPRNEGETLAQSADEIRNIIIFQQEVVELKTENPGLTIVEATIIAAETGTGSTIAIEEVTKKVDEIVTEQLANGQSNKNDGQAKAKAAMDKKIDKKITAAELSWLNRIVEYIYTNFYTQN